MIGSFKYEPTIFDLNPLGGSLVIWTPFYKIAVGNASLGYDVSHNLNSGWIFSFSLRSSQIFSKVGIHDTERWQFYKTTQMPSFIP